MRHLERKRLAKKAFREVSSLIQAIIDLQEEIETHMADGRKRILAKDDSWLYNKLEQVKLDAIPIKMCLESVEYIIKRKSLKTKKS